MQELEYHMAEALQEARWAYEEEEVPVGAVLVSPAGEKIASTHNRTRQLNDPTGHAEILLLREAARFCNNYRLPGTTLFVTIEPCLMCAGAIIQARVEKVVFGAFDPRAGALGSVYDVSRDRRLNHRFKVVSGVLEQECRDLMQNFFKLHRGNNP
jgi:tRNA(adenine34) deaminase